MQIEEVPAPEPGSGEVRVRTEAIGVNFIDINHRSGAYPVQLPFTPGSEAAGVVDELGEGVESVERGQRVAFVRGRGAYAEQVLVEADRLVAIPDGVDDATAAAALLQGMTSHYLLNSICSFEPGDWCLVHAAAGGVGTLLTQMAKLKDLRVIGTTSTATKAEIARAAGADHVIVYSEEDFVERTREFTGGAGVRAVFDAVGKDTFEDSLRCLARYGHMIFYGQASGPPGPLDPRRLAKGSLFLTRPSFDDYISTPEDTLWRGAEVLDLVARGKMEVRIFERYVLADAPDAHRALQSRATTGKLVLLPYPKRVKQEDLSQEAGDGKRI